MYKFIVFGLIGAAALFFAKLAGQDSSGNTLQFRDPTGVFTTIIGGPRFISRMMRSSEASGQTGEHALPAMSPATAGQLCLPTFNNGSPKALG